MNDNTVKFLDLMDKANTAAKALGFNNAVDWGSAAYCEGIINDHEFYCLKKCNSLRNKIAHGNAVELEIYNKTLLEAKSLVDYITNPDRQPKPKKKVNKIVWKVLKTIGVAAAGVIAGLILGSS